MTPRTCIVAECDRDFYCKEMCKRHYYAAYTAANSDKIRAWAARHYAANRDSERKKRAEYYANNPDAFRAAALRRYYNLTPSDYAAMLSAQGGGCAGCGATSGANGTRLAVDHDHSCCPGAKSCGRCIRGLLCTNCNQSLGKTKDDPTILLRLAEYLTAHCGISVDESGDVA